MTKRDCWWPKCHVQIPAEMLMCKTHWYKLPKEFRDRVWATYRPAQGEDGEASAEYYAVLKKIRAWIRGQTPAQTSLFGDETR